MEVRLDQFRNSWYRSGRGRAAHGLWFFIGGTLLRSRILPGSALRRVLLRSFGARVGRGVVLKPALRVKFPWLLTVGDHSWLGEDVWIDNLAPVTIGSHCCISQGAYLCTGNHDWSDPTFPLITKPITVCSGAWVGAKSVLCPGVTVHECGVASAGSVVCHDIPAYEIHIGNPAAFVRVRYIHVSRDVPNG